MIFYQGLNNNNSNDCIQNKRTFKAKQKSKRNTTERVEVFSTVYFLSLETDRFCL